MTLNDVGDLDQIPAAELTKDPVKLGGSGIGAVLPLLGIAAVLIWISSAATSPRRSSLSG